MVFISLHFKQNESQFEYNNNSFKKWFFKINVLTFMGGERMLDQSLMNFQFLSNRFFIQCYLFRESSFFLQKDIIWYFVFKSLYLHDSSHRNNLEQMEIRLSGSGYLNVRTTPHYDQTRYQAGEKSMNIYQRLSQFLL